MQLVCKITCLKYLAGSHFVWKRMQIGYSKVEGGTVLLWKHCSGASAKLRGSKTLWLHLAIVPLLLCYPSLQISISFNPQYEQWPYDPNTSFLPLHLSYILWNQEDTTWPVSSFELHGVSFDLVWYNQHPHHRQLAKQTLYGCFDCEAAVPGGKQTKAKAVNDNDPYNKLWSLVCGNEVSVFLCEFSVDRFVEVIQFHHVCFKNLCLVVFVLITT